MFRKSTVLEDYDGRTADDTTSSLLQNRTVHGFEVLEERLVFLVNGTSSYPPLIT